MDKIFDLLMDTKCYQTALHGYLKGYPVADIAAIIDAQANSKRLNIVRSVIDHYNGSVDFYNLLRNCDTLLKPLIALADKHRVEGTRPDYLISAFKTANSCYEEILLNSALNRDECMKFIVNLRRIYDVFEIIAVGRWFIKTAEAYNMAGKKAKLAMRQLSTRYEALLNQFDYPVIVTDHTGIITEINRTAQKYFAVDEKPQRMHIFAVLDYHYLSFEEFVSTYEFNPDKNMRFLNGDMFSSKLMKLSKSAYMFSLIPSSGELSGSTPDDHVYKLTQTELSVYNRVNSGMTSKQIADELGVSEDTIKTHRRNLRKKLGLNRNTSP